MDKITVVTVEVVTMIITNNNNNDDEKRYQLVNIFVTLIKTFAVEKSAQVKLIIIQGVPEKTLHLYRPQR